GRADEALLWLQKAAAIDERYAEVYSVARFRLVCDLAFGVPLAGKAGCGSGPGVEARPREQAGRWMPSATRSPQAVRLGSSPEAQTLMPCTPPGLPVPDDGPRHAARPVRGSSVRGAVRMGPGLPPGTFRLNPSHLYDDEAERHSNGGDRPRRSPAGWR